LENNYHRNFEVGQMTAIKKLFCSCCAIFLPLVLAFPPALAAGSDSLEKFIAGTQRERPFVYHPEYHDYACYLGGVSNPEGSLAEYEDTPVWDNYAAGMDRNWERLEKRQLQPMKRWAAKELKEVATATVFYPFSGADFLNVYALFPNAKTYLMLALEPVGTIPDLDGGGNCLADLERALRGYLYATAYFVTARMQTQLARSQLKGVLPVLMFFLAREKARVLDIRYWVMRGDGSLEERQALESESYRDGIPGVRLVFEGPGVRGRQTLYYFQVNLQDSSFGRHPRFRSFLKSFAPFTSFSKSASFLLPNPDFSEIRQFILNQSHYVLQTDSEIPLKHFAPETWNLRFYGTYTGPTPLFRGRYQKDLALAYQEGKDIYPLPFGIGYHYEAGTSNLLFAAKKPKKQLIAREKQAD
jgi:hypothetical protein